MAKDLPKSVKRFGSRYGRRVRLQFGLIEREHRDTQKCPYCNYQKVKRLSAGIWHCKKCDSKFAGKAYSI